MCSVSMAGDFYRDKWRDERPNLWPGIYAPNPPTISREEFESLKKEVLDMKELLKRAKAYDERNGEPDCGVDEKMDLLRRVAKLVGVELNDVLGSKREGTGI
jgi:hypothetical protein